MSHNKNVCVCMCGVFVCVYGLWMYKCLCIHMCVRVSGDPSITLDTAPQNGHALYFSIQDFYWLTCSLLIKEDRWPWRPSKSYIHDPTTLGLQAHTCPAFPLFKTTFNSNIFWSYSFSSPNPFWSSPPLYPPNLKLIIKRETNTTKPIQHLPPKSRKQNCI